jgi:hypothetical protein
MEALSLDERISLAENLNWDYEIDASELLDVIDGKIPKAGPFDAPRLLVRSLERLSWHRMRRFHDEGHSLDSTIFEFAERSEEFGPGFGNQRSRCRTESGNDSVFRDEL